MENDPPATRQPDAGYLTATNRFSQAAFAKRDVPFEFLEIDETGGQFVLNWRQSNGRINFRCVARDVFGLHLSFGMARRRDNPEPRIGW